MSAHPALAALAARVLALGPHRAATAKHLSALGLDTATEETTQWVLNRLVARDEALTAVAKDAVSLLSVAQRTGQIDEAAGVAVLARLRAALGAP